MTDDSVVVYVGTKAYHLNPLQESRIMRGDAGKRVVRLLKDAWFNWVVRESNDPGAIEALKEIQGEIMDEVRILQWMNLLPWEKSDLVLMFDVPPLGEDGEPEPEDEWEEMVRLLMPPFPPRPFTREPNGTEVYEYRKRG